MKAYYLYDLFKLFQAPNNFKILDLYNANYKEN